MRLLRVRLCGEITVRRYRVMNSDKKLRGHLYCVESYAYKNSKISLMGNSFKRKSASEIKDQHPADPSYLPRSLPCPVCGKTFDRTATYYQVVS